MVVTCREREAGTGGKEAAKEREWLRETEKGSLNGQRSGKREACSLIRAKTVIK
jgi:hypothetical protein